MMKRLNDSICNILTGMIMSKNIYDCKF